MSATISLGKNYTISGALSNVSDLTVTRVAEKIDVTTRFGTKPLRFTEAGLPKITLECTVIAEEDTTYDIGAEVNITCTDYTGDAIVVNADREEPDDGPVQYKLTLTPGTPSTETVTV